jgi:hypothetical protein
MGGGEKTGFKVFDSLLKGLFQIEGPTTRSSVAPTGSSTTAIFRFTVSTGSPSGACLGNSHCGILCNNRRSHRATG